ncbi:DNA photolyase family protein [Mycolicibacterium rufum]|uniref:DNA photolyase family protein n=1 Tax=Mycolicibacterium rufum TaxID=318424 RepID=A0A9X2XZR3_9MYCO|nr:deoxyribodipyrimidine photo-lyase [Mycolicibacterium rufum]KGI67762.1 deoxyribodipyrimidine photolyase [Mycolicibacterium rufum]MCV7071522.1 deoxyribodipyrimidine photo-lyase [Mycolicibacterium rufum]ULP38738.1 DNA photolyase family protein [Mycolicibacterium rufum]
MTAVMWFRRDLRLADLPALLAAAGDDGADGEVLGCYVLDPRLEASAGPRRLRYLYDALRDLQEQLDGRLLITRGDPASRIPALAKAVDAHAVHVSGDFTPFGRRRDDQVREALGDIELVATGSPYLVSPGRVTKPDGSPYKVFTPFFSAWRKHGWRPPAESGPTSARWIDPSSVKGAKGAKVVEIPDVDVELEVPAGERAARRQWKQFLDGGVRGYADDRNRPDLAATSKMSAHLKFGAIHPRTMAADLGRGTGATAYLRELGFRDFYASVLHAWPRSVWWNFNSAFDAIEVDEGDDAEKAFEAWKAGKTGFPIVDAGMRQLATTGFMHNRVRMIVASFLVKDLHLPWQWGARWFLDQLVDGDMANNQHGWQWAAGCGTDAAPYFRVFNPTTQGTKFDPSGDYIRRWVPELADVPDVHKLDGDRPADYPKPIVDHGHERAEALRRYNALG